MLFLAHCQIYADTASAIEQALSPGPNETVVGDDIGPEQEWHPSYNKLYRAFWYTLRPRHARVTGRLVGFELAAISQVLYDSSGGISR